MMQSTTTGRKSRFCGPRFNSSLRKPISIADPNEFPSLGNNVTAPRFQPSRHAHARYFNELSERSNFTRNETLDSAWYQPSLSHPSSSSFSRNVHFNNGFQIRNPTAGNWRDEDRSTRPWMPHERNADPKRSSAPQNANNRACNNAMESNQESKTKKKKNRKSKIKRQAEQMSGKLLILSPEMYSRILGKSNPSDASQRPSALLADVSNSEEYPELGSASVMKTETVTKIRAKGASKLSRDEKVPKSVFREPEVLPGPSDQARNFFKDGAAEKPQPHVTSPITIHLLDIVSTTTKKKEAMKKGIFCVDKEKMFKARLKGHNVLDSSSPVVKRGKEREKPKVKRKSNMKKIILMDRQRRKEFKLAKVLDNEQKDTEKPEVIDSESTDCATKNEFFESVDDKEIDENIKEPKTQDVVTVEHNNDSDNSCQSKSDSFKEDGANLEAIGEKLLLEQNEEEEIIDSEGMECAAKNELVESMGDEEIDENLKESKTEVASVELKNDYLCYDNPSDFLTGDSANLESIDKNLLREQSTDETELIEEAIVALFSLSEHSRCSSLVSLSDVELVVDGEHSRCSSVVSLSDVELVMIEEEVLFPENLAMHLEREIKQEPIEEELLDLEHLNNEVVEEEPLEHKTAPLEHEIKQEIVDEDSSDSEHPLHVNNEAVEEEPHCSLEHLTALEHEIEQGVVGKDFVEGQSQLLMHLKEEIKQEAVEKDDSDAMENDSIDPGHEVKEDEDRSEDLILQGDEEPMESFDENKVKAAKILIHTRKYKQYCTHLQSDDIAMTTQALIEDLARFQDRLHQKNPTKARIKRRLIYGIREVTKHLRLKKPKCVVIATDLEDVKAEGGLNDAVSNLISCASDQQIPCVFALPRKLLGKVCHKPVPVSCVGILNYEGSETNFKKMLELVTEGQKLYTNLQRFFLKALDDESVTDLLETCEQHPGTLQQVRERILLCMSITSEHRSKDIADYFDSLKLKTQ